MYPFQYTDENGYDHTTNTHFCIYCNSPIEAHGEVVKDHVLCVWKHFGFISFPEELATDEKGFTIEGVVVKGARRALAPIPVQNRVQFCLECFPKELKREGCAYCSNPVDTSDQYSKLECLNKYTSGINSDLRWYVFHHDCLPVIFTNVREYLEQFS
jgi:hypothetical protein